MNKEDMTILIVSDDMIWRKTLREMLNYRFSSPWIEMASNAEKALKIIEENRISLVISDVWLQGISGLKLFSKVKAHKDIPFILMPGEPYTEKEVKKMGVKYSIAKPFLNRDLVRLIRKAWNDRIEIK